MSKAKICSVRPRLFWSRHACDGTMLSGVMVAQITTPISSLGMPAIAIAFSAASVPRDRLVSWSAKCRSEMPVRVEIHSSLVSTMVAISSLVTVRVGTLLPVPQMRIPMFCVMFM